ncbi:MAG: rod shape-determining protein MreC [Bacteroidales bacterium]|nr:rod shape-determining protein MreC [Bacteroidales bacterium]MBR6305780.1 rod shape-determining protein MreC [Bacteroidales bacterium]
MRRRSWIPALINLAVFIALEAACVHFMSRNGELQKAWLAKGAHAVTGTFWGGVQSVTEFFSLRGTNRALAEENAALRAELERTRAMFREACIDTMKYHGASRGYEYIWAEAVRLSRNRQHNYIILNRGFEDGVKEKSGVITSCGVVGIVEAVSAHHSFAFSFMNSDISISARLGGEQGAVGPLVWDGRNSNKAVLKEIPLQYRFQPGDTVYTSGHSLLFPADIPLGVAGESRMVNGATNEIKVTLFQDFRSIRYVSIVHNKSLQEIEEGSL